MPTASHSHPERIKDWGSQEAKVLVLLALQVLSVVPGGQLGSHCSPIPGPIRERLPSGSPSKHVPQRPWPACWLPQHAQPAPTHTPWLPLSVTQGREWPLHWYSSWVLIFLELSTALLPCGHEARAGQFTTDLGLLRATHRVRSKAGRPPLQWSPETPISLWVFLRDQ